MADAVTGDEFLVALPSQRSGHLLSFLEAPDGYNAICLTCGQPFRHVGEWSDKACPGDGPGGACGP